MRYFNNNTKLISSEVKRFLSLQNSDKYIINALYKAETDMIPSFATSAIFDSDFIFNYYDLIINRTFNQIKHLIEEDHLVFINLFKETIKTKRLIPSDSVVKLLIDLQKKTKDAKSPGYCESTYYFCKSFYGACTGIGGIEFDLSIALAHLSCNGEDVRKKQIYYLNQFRQDLINQIFEHYPNETRRFKSIKYRNEMKQLLKI